MQENVNKMSSCICLRIAEDKLYEALVVNKHVYET